MATGEEFKFPDEIETKEKPQETNETEVEIEVVDDTPERDRGRKPLEKEVSDPTDDEIESYSSNVQARIKELTHARHDERRVKEAVLREKQELERLAQQLIAENNKLKQSYNANQEVLTQTAQQKTDADLVMARKKLKEAHEAFDTDAIIAAQEELAEAKMRAEAWKNYRPTPLQETEVPVQNAPQTQTKVDPDEKTLRWQAKNQWFGQPGFEEYTSYALGLHQKLVSGGTDPRSDEYFDQIDGRMKSKFPELFGGAEDKPKSGEVQKKPTTVVAPANRSTASGKIRLTQTQVALAKKLGLTPQQYAAQVARLENQNG
ncbi:hypothetical protein EBT31_10885 [bacterium]|nr:hypothetical protein [bacterium]